MLLGGAPSKINQGESQPQSQTQFGKIGNLHQPNHLKSNDERGTYFLNYIDRVRKIALEDDDRKARTYFNPLRRIYITKLSTPKLTSRPKCIMQFALPRNLSEQIILS